MRNTVAGDRATDVGESPILSPNHSHPGGDALLRYLECRPGNIDTDHVFIRSNAPRRSFASGDGVSSVVKHALKRANIDAPAKGAHLLRHTAATEMLRTGVPLDQATRHPRAFGAAKVSKPLSVTGER